MRDLGKPRASVPSSARKRSCTAYSFHQSDPWEGQAVSGLAGQLFAPHQASSCNQPWKANLGSTAYHNSLGSCPENSSLSARAETRQAHSSPLEPCCFCRLHLTLFCDR